MKTLLLISADPHSQSAKRALDFAKKALNNHQPLAVFFYGNGAYTANRLIWQTADITNIADEWCQLSEQFGLPLPVCVSTALARGICDTDNAKRHQLDGDNLKPPFRLVGLSELALLLDDETTLLQF